MLQPIHSVSYIKDTRYYAKKIIYTVLIEWYISILLWSRYNFKTDIIILIQIYFDCIVRYHLKLCAHLIYWFIANVDIFTHTEFCVKYLFLIDVKWYWRWWSIPPKYLDRFPLCKEKTYQSVTFSLDQNNLGWLLVFYPKFSLIITHPLMVALTWGHITFKWPVNISLMIYLGGRLPPSPIPISSPALYHLG